MGREIRRVPPNWGHPKVTSHWGEEGFQPMYDRMFENAANEWKREYTEFYTNRPEGADGDEFWEYHGEPPDREYYRPWKDEEATWWQAWETVSEGTPVSPPFATQEELAQYLAVNGDFWDQKRRDGGRSSMNCEPWGIERARRFVFDAGWAPSMVIENGKAMSGVEFVTKAPR